MKYNKIHAAVLAAALLSAGCFAAEAASGRDALFSMSIGIGYRSFSDVDFRHPSLIGPAGAAGLGDMQADSPEARQALVGSSTAPFKAISNLPAAKADRSVDGADEFLPMLSFSYRLCEQRGMFLSAVSNLQYFDFHLKSKASDCLPTNVILIPSLDLGAPGPGTGAVHDLSMKADVRGLVWDLGLTTTCPLSENLDLDISVGPSFNFVKMQTSFSSSGSDVDRLAIGLYVSAGLTYWLDPSYGIGLDLRYDKVFDEIETRYASLDLDAFSGGVKFTYRF